MSRNKAPIVNIGLYSDHRKQGAKSLRKMFFVFVPNRLLQNRIVCLERAKSNEVLEMQ